MTKLSPSPSILASLTRTILSLFTVSLLILFPLLVPYADMASSQAGPTATRDESSTYRVIVRLHEAPAARALKRAYPQKDGIDLQAEQAIRYVAQMKETQRELSAEIRRTIPGVEIEGSYQVIFNGLSVRLPKGDKTAVERLRELPCVSMIYEETAFHPALYSSVSAIKTQVLWDEIGGSEKAGTGVKIAILDSGINVDHPMFDDSTFAYPTGFPKGDARYTTRKIIAARAFFRPTAPPSTGEEAPVPGPSGSGHGTHIAGIAAGNQTVATYHGLSQEISGVAPRAWLMNYRIFYPSEESDREIAYTTEILQAIEAAVVDGADVICNSWSSTTPRLPFASPEAEALEGAIEVGCVVVAAAGNEGPGYGSTSRIPGGIERVITVGATSKDKIVVYDLVDVVGQEPIPPELDGQPFTRALFGGEISEVFGPFSYRDVRDADPTDSSLACQPLSIGTLANAIALISRGDCHFADKVYHAQEAGARLALIYNADDADELVEMACGGEHCGDGEITISAAMVSRAFGQAALSWLQTHPDARLQLDPGGRLISSDANVVPSNSGRGPAYMRYLKPDLLAPGVSVLSAYHDTNSSTIPYAQLGGSSMACAHVAGAAALLLQAHPLWGHDEIKSALMATARISNIHAEGSSTPASVLTGGAGLVDLSLASNPALLFSPPSLSISQAVPGEHYSLQLALRDPRTHGATRTYDILTESGSNINITMEPHVVIGANSNMTIDVIVDIPIDTPSGDAEADLHFMSGELDVHVPIWVHIVPPIKEADVLLIDNDFSLFESYVDYSGYVIDALEEAGISYQVHDADQYFDCPQTIPDLEELQEYDVVIWLTGDNTHSDGYYAVSTPLTALDMQILASYLDSGGHIIAMGQNFAQASDVNESEDATWGRADFYHNYLGAHWIQGSLFDPEDEGRFPPQGSAGVIGLPDSFLAGMALHLGPVGDGASNQSSIDEIASGGVPDGSDLDLVHPVLLTLEAIPLEAGYVGVAKSDEPTLEDETVSIPYRSVYYSFGFEGINNALGTTSRSQFLKRTIDWLLDQASVTLGDEIVSSVNTLTQIGCQAKSSLGAENVSYRWRLDSESGSQIVNSSVPTITHTYSERGTYPLAVEVTDSLGHKAIAHSTVTIVAGGTSTFAASRSEARRGEEIAYQITVRNTEANALSMSLSLPLPPGTEHVSHEGGAFSNGVLRWSGNLPPDTYSGVELCVRIRYDAEPGAMVATVQFQAGGDVFSKSVSTRIWAQAYVPLIIKG